MKIVVISDSHYQTKYLDAVKSHLEDADVLLHCGDGAPDTEYLKRSFKGEVYAVSGNCDILLEYPKERLLDFNGVKIFISHGDRYNVKSEYHSIVYRCKEVGADIGLFGHSHKAIVEKDQGVTIMNPGSVFMPYGGEKRTIGIIEILEDKNFNIHLEKI